MPDVVLVVTVGTALMLLLGVFIAFMALTYQKRRLEHQRQLMELSENYQREILKTQIEMQEQTFLSISQEIHDNVGQILSLARVYLNSLENSLSDTPAQKVTTSKELIDQAIGDLRDLSKRLNSKYTSQQSLPDLLQYQLGLIEKTGAAATSFALIGNRTALMPEKKLFVFRIAQEALNNCLKHAKASSIDVQLEYEALYLRLVITDDGIGFDSAPLDSASGKGTGLHNMRYRASLIGADFLLHSTPSSGTSLTLTVPLT